MNNSIKLQRIIVCLIALSSATIARAENRAKTIAPFLDAQTLAIVHVDVSQINTQACYDYVMGLVPQIASPEEKEQLKIELQQLQQQVQSWITDFIAADGKEIYLISSMADFPSFFMIVPTKDKSHDQALCDSLRKLQPADHTQSPMHLDAFERYNNIIFSGRQLTLDRLKTQHPALHPHLKAAFTAAGPSTAQLLLIPGADTLRVFNEMLPLLLQEIGYTSTPPDLTQCNYAALSLNLPPKISLNARIQTQNTATAQSIKSALDQLYQFILQHPHLKKYFPEATRLLSLLTPTIKNNQITLSLTGKNINTIAIDLFKNLIPSARANAHRVRCMGQLRQIGQAIMLYQNDFKDKNPPNLDILIKTEQLHSKILNCPSFHGKDQDKTYVYRGNDLDARISGNAILAYDSVNNHPERRNVLFADSHVESMSEAQFQKAIAKDNEIRRASKLAEKPLE